MKLLIVGNEIHVANLLRRALTEEGTCLRNTPGKPKFIHRVRGVRYLIRKDGQA